MIIEDRETEEREREEKCERLKESKDESN